MGVDVRPEVLVRRPRAEVAAFMFDPANDLRWTGGITSSRPAQPGPLVTGAKVERTASFLGRTFTYGYVVTEHQPGRLVQLKVDRPSRCSSATSLTTPPAGRGWPSTRPGHRAGSSAGPPPSWPVRCASPSPATSAGCAPHWRTNAGVGHPREETRRRGPGAAPLLVGAGQCPAGHARLCGDPGPRPVTPAGPTGPGIRCRPSACAGG